MAIVQLPPMPFFEDDGEWFYEDEEGQLINVTEKTVWWHCQKCKGTWLAWVKTQMDKNKCPYCVEEKRLEKEAQDEVEN